MAKGRAAADLLALTASDPASRGSWRYVLDSYASYRAVLSYRLAHAAVEAAEELTDGTAAGDLRALGRSISESAKVATGVEIHPAARIGHRLVLDHGTGTVIGETTVIGDDCYLLQGVILGATGIAGNATGKRHPTLGDRVEVGAFVRILGPVVIGSDAMLAPHTLVLTDIRAGSRVLLMNQCQVCGPSATASILAVLPWGRGGLQIHGTGLAGAQVDFIDRDGSPARHLPVEIVARTPSRIDCRISGGRIPSTEVLRICDPGGGDVLLTQLDAVWRHLTLAAKEPSEVVH